MQADMYGAAVFSWVIKGFSTEIFMTVHFRKYGKDKEGLNLSAGCRKKWTLENVESIVGWMR